MDKLFNTFKKEGYIKTYNPKIKPYNQGYELKFNVREEYDSMEKLRNENKDLYIFISGLIFSSTSVFVQPTTYFEEDLEEGRSTKIESKILELKGIDTPYPYFEVKNKNEIKKKTDEFVNINKWTS